MSPVRQRTEVFKIQGFVRKRFLPSPPLPHRSFFGSRPIFRAGKIPKTPFLGLSLLPHSTETLATQARSKLAGADAGAYNFAMAKIELSDTSFIAVQIIKNSFLSPNPEGLQFFILTIVPRATNSRCCCF